MPCAASARASGLLPWLAAGLAAGLLFAAEADYGLDLTDEGFLWLGVERTARGEVPERDFQAGYEPGRFYWGALCQRALGPGLHSLRAATALFGGLGLALGLCAGRRGGSGPASQLALAALLALWMGPRHKLFDPALALFAVLVATRLLERPEPRRHALAGASVGLALCFGRNHALYASAAFSLCLAWLWIRSGRRPGRRELLAGAAGALLGTSPLVALALLAPGYGHAFFENLRFYAVQGPNHPLPIPWPWRSGALAHAPGISLGFALEAVLPAAMLASLWRRPAEPAQMAAPVAAASVALAYSHHAFARADAAHLAQAFPPLLLALSLWPAGCERLALRPALLAALAGLTLLGLPDLRPILAHRLEPGGIPLATVRVSGRSVQVEAPQAAQLEALQRIVEERVPANARLLAAPALPGVHPWLGRAPVGWRSYFLWPASADDERRLLEELARPGPTYALLQTGAPFGIDALRFERSYPRVHAELMQHYQPLLAPGELAGFLLLERPKR